MSLSTQQKEEILDIQDQQAPTKRAVVPEMENILYEPFQVLDKGFIRVVDYMGDDNAIVQAARVSYGKGTKQISNDRGLIRYLMRHRHTTPFEMCEIKLHIKLPIFIARQWIRHRTANVNEYSARYSILEDEFYVPARNVDENEELISEIAPQSLVNKQGRDGLFSLDEIKSYRDQIANHSTDSYNFYQSLLNEDKQGNPINENETGVARETARMVLPANIYTQWYWKIDLHNLLHFIKLRADAHAQYEIRMYADILGDIVKKWVPTAYEAFDDYVVSGTHISKGAKFVISQLANGKEIQQSESSLSKREWNELIEQLDLPLAKV